MSSFKLIFQLKVTLYDEKLCNMLHLMILLVVNMYYFHLAAWGLKFDFIEQTALLKHNISLCKSNIPLELL